MRLLLNDIDPAITSGTEVDRSSLADLYAYPERPTGGAAGRPWLRANMVSTLDGAASGEDGRTGSINTEADRQVFALLRTLSDVILVGAGTARAEGYRAVRPATGWLASLREGRPPAPCLAVVTRTGSLPLQLTLPPEEGEDADRLGEVLLITCGAADERAVDAARTAIGESRVLVLGEDRVDLPGAVELLAARGLTRMLTEGGPHLLRDLAAAGLVDEICLTVVPHLLAGAHPRILAGEGVDLPLTPRLLLESEGTLLGRWSRPDGPGQSDRA